MFRPCSIKRDNPMKSQWNSMRLYLQSQVETVAIRKYGSLQAMEQQRRNGALIQTKRRIRDAQADRIREEAEKERLEVRGCYDTSSSRHIDCTAHHVLPMRLAMTYGNELVAHDSLIRVCNRRRGNE